MPWFSRRIVCSPQLMNAIQNRFEMLFVNSGAPEEMLLVAEYDGTGDITLWARIPARWVTAFPELASCEENDIPEMAIMLVGNQEQLAPCLVMS
jgi:hypothetical protein